MSWTKRQLVQQAFNENGYASFAYSLPEEQILIAKYQLDAMMAAWNGRGLQLGYPLQSNPTSTDIDEETGVPDWAVEAIYTNLALKIAPSIGKTASLELKKSARESYRVVLLHRSFPKERQFPETLPKGAGNRTWGYGNEYFPIPSEETEIFEGDGVIDLE